jgi:hypothetical protein
MVTSTTNAIIFRVLQEHIVVGSECLLEYCVLQVHIVVGSEYSWAIMTNLGHITGPL